MCGELKGEKILARVAWKTACDRCLDDGCFYGAMPDVTTHLHAGETNSVRDFVGAALGRLNVMAQCGDTQHPVAVDHELIAIGAVPE